MIYLIIAIVALIVGYELGPRVVGVARKEYDAAIDALRADIDALKAKLP